MVSKTIKQPYLHASHFVVGPKAPRSDRKKEESAAEAKATAMSRTFSRPVSMNATAGEASLEERVLGRLMGMVSQLPGLQDAPVFLAKIGKMGGPFFSTLAFGFTGVETAANWRHMDTVERTFGVATTTASAVAAATTIAASRGVAAAADLVAPAAGIAGTLFSAGAAWQCFHNPYTNSGQRGMALLALTLQAAGTALGFTPLAPVGIVMMLAGAHFSIFGGWLGKHKAVNTICRELGIQGGSHARKAV